MDHCALSHSAKATAVSLLNLNQDKMCGEKKLAKVPKSALQKGSFMRTDYTQ